MSEEEQPKVFQSQQSQGLRRNDSLRRDGVIRQFYLKQQLQDEIHEDEIDIVLANTENGQAGQNLEGTDAPAVSTAPKLVKNVSLRRDGSIRRFYDPTRRTVIDVDDDIEGHNANRAASVDDSDDTSSECGVSGGAAEEGKQEKQPAPANSAPHLQRNNSLRMDGSIRQFYDAKRSPVIDVDDHALGELVDDESDDDTSSECEVGEGKPGVIEQEQQPVPIAREVVAAGAQ